MNEVDISWSEIRTITVQLNNYIYITKMIELIFVTSTMIIIHRWNSWFVSWVKTWSRQPECMSPYYYLNFNRLGEIGPLLIMACPVLVAGYERDRPKLVMVNSLSLNVYQIHLWILILVLFVMNLFSEWCKRLTGSGGARCRIGWSFVKKWSRQERWVKRIREEMMVSGI